MSYNQANKNLKYHKRPDGSLRLSIECKTREGQARTEQSHKGECDIKNIVRRYAKLGEPLPIPDAKQYTGENVILPPDYSEAMRLVASAQSRFASLSSSIRDRFKNDPSEYLAFLQNPANAAEAIKLGMAIKRPVAPPPDAPEVPSKTAKVSPKTPPANDGGGQPKGGSDQ